eukprot:562099-Hanusia_phi.AAC.1
MERILKEEKYRISHVIVVGWCNMCYSSCDILLACRLTDCWTWAFKPLSIQFLKNCQNFGNPSSPLLSSPLLSSPLVSSPPRLLSSPLVSSRLFSSPLLASPRLASPRLSSPLPCSLVSDLVLPALLLLLAGAPVSSLLP